MADDRRKVSRSKDRLQMKPSSMQQSDVESSQSSSMTGITIESLVWKDLNEEQIILLIDMTPQQLELKMAEIFSFCKYHICLKEASLLDFYVTSFWFAKQSQFTPEQISAFFSLVKILLENIRDENMPIAKNIYQLKRYLAMCSNPDKTARSSMFNIFQMKLISDYVMNSLFQHYKLYQLLFSSQTTNEPVIKQKLLVEVPPNANVPFPPPLDEGLPEEIHSEQVLGLRQSDINVECNDVKECQAPVNVEDNVEACKDKIAKESYNKQEKQEPSFVTLKPDEMKQVLKVVSEGILNEVKGTVQKKLKERESMILTKMAKR